MINLFNELNKFWFFLLIKFCRESKEIFCFFSKISLFDEKRANEKDSKIFDKNFN